MEPHDIERPCSGIQTEQGRFFEREATAAGIDVVRYTRFFRFDIGTTPFVQARIRLFGVRALRGQRQRREWGVSGVGLQDLFGDGGFGEAAVHGLFFDVAVGFGLVHL